MSAPSTAARCRSILRLLLARLEAAGVWSPRIMPSPTCMGHGDAPPPISFDTVEERGRVVGRDLRNSSICHAGWSEQRSRAHHPVQGGGAICPPFPCLDVKYFTSRPQGPAAAETGTDERRMAERASWWTSHPATR